MFGGIAIFILMLACINFINLSTAKSANRAKEVGLRKVVGSQRTSLVQQFLSESILFSVVSFLLALIILWAALPYFNQLAGKTIIVPWSAWWFFPILISAALIVGIIAGLYPSFYLSSFKPIDVLKGSVARGMKNSHARSTMVVFQFTTSIILIVGTFVIHKQMNFMLTKKVGFDKEQVVMVHGANTLDKQQQSFKDELLKLADVQNVTISNYLPVEGTNRDQNMFWRDGKSQEEIGIGAQIWEVDENYIGTMGMKLAAGRNFDRNLASDSSAIIINQSMAKDLGLKNPLGERIMNWRSWHVIGVVEDFHFNSMKGKIGSLCFVRGRGGNIASVKVNTTNMQNAIQSISTLWKKFMPHQAIRYSFLDESYARMYDDVRRTGNIFASFAILAIIVACLGLFALSAFMVEQRNKEISIRLVLGASLQSIFRLLTDQFIKLVLISFVLAVPASWYMMQAWLKDYEYRIGIGWEVFLISGLLSVVIALLTVSYQSIRAALANPANSLRSE
jgi:putative ABC transport system permease protein